MTCKGCNGTNTVTKIRYDGIWYEKPCDDCMGYCVQIIDKSTRDLVETVVCRSKRDAEVILGGILVNLDHSEFEAKIIEAE